MSAIRQVSNGGTSTSGAGVTLYGPATVSGIALNSTETVRQITYRTAGVLSRLTANKTAGDRTTMRARIRVATANGNGLINFTSTNGIYEDLTGTDSIAAGTAVDYALEGGSGGTTSVNVSLLASDWAATGTTTCHLNSCALAPGSASTTYYCPPGAGSAVTTTQTDGEWLVKLPPGVDHVTLKNLYVRQSNAPTNGATISVNGATGTGTAPTVTTSNSIATLEDTTHSIQAKDGDKISFKIITGAGATLPQLSVVSVEVQSDDGVSFLTMGVASGISFGLTDFRQIGGGSTAQSTTETGVQGTAGALAGQSITNLAVNVTVAGTGSGVGLRSNAGAAGKPAQLKVNTTGTGWTTDTADMFIPVASDLLDYSSVFGSGAATVACVAITCQSKGPNPKPTLVQAVTRSAVI